MTVQALATAPAILAQPVSVSTKEGGNAALSVTASGSPAPVFQWSRNGVPLLNGGNVSGATSATLNLSNVSTMDAGSYTVSVSNSAGAVTSAAAAVTVEAAPEAGIPEDKQVAVDGVPAGFSVSGYLERNPQHASKFASDPLGAWHYYRDFGVQAGEIYDDLFRAEEYLALYPELLAVLGADLKAALLHWLESGMGEGRLGRIPTNFSASGYFERNPDVASAMGGNPILAWQHFWKYGIYEGRSFDDTFNAFEYLALNPDLMAAFSQDWRAATLHWLRYGNTEGRLGRVPFVFDVNHYLGLYPEVGAVWGTYQSTVFQHFWYFGVFEARNFDNAFRVDDYLALNPDVAAVIGNNRQSAFMHWVRYGRDEGRATKR